jgi:hypothetical protein
MEQNRDVQESPDRWVTRLMRAVRPHGRFAVISSSATAGVLLVLGGVVFASQTNDSSDVSSPTQSAVSSKLNPDGSPTPGTSPTATTTTVLGNNSKSVPESGAQGTITTNTTVSGSPTTVASPTPTTGLTSTTSPTTVLGVATTTTQRLRNQNGALLPTLLADATSSTDDPVLNLKLSAGDKDGYISRIVVNWGDQSTWTVIDYPLSSCVEPLNSLVSPSAMHTYTQANSYTVSVTVTSVNCVGDGAQQAIATKQVSVGGSETTTTPPPTTTTTTP